MSELKVDKVSPRTGTYVSLNTVGSKNIIINGDMSIAQRGTSTAYITSGGYYKVDRLETVISSLGTWTQSQSTDVPSGQGFATSLKMDCTTADASPSASDELRIRQNVEGQNLQYLKKGTSNAESLTISFWVKSNKTGTYIAELMDNDNSNRHIGKSYTISSADTWEKKILTFEGDTTGAFDNDNGAALAVSFWLGAGSNYTSGTLQTSWGSLTQANRAVGQVNLADSTSNEFYLTGVQLEAGTTASEYEFLPFDTQLQRCLRYFEKSMAYSIAPADHADSPWFAGGNGWAAYASSAIRSSPILFQCEKRANPTIVIYAGNTQITDGNLGWFNGSAWEDAGNSIPK